ncbi:hypothetical protein EJ110_NYTH22800 [Nymphaea thermarum]|nr:hypothetical protein EJ110_NYTH22800 [Nymphaea thermarum]
MHGGEEEEVKKLKEIFVPLTTMHLITYLRSMTSVLCMGKLGSLELAGGALAMGFTNITGYSLLSGLALGMEPICSQAFELDAITISPIEGTG